MPSPIVFPDLVVEILLHLPTKSLLLFRCVSKPLSALIHSPHFVKMHLHMSIRTKTSLRLILWSRETLLTTPQTPRAMDIYATDFDNGLIEAIKLHNPLKNSASSGFVIGCCDGLILLQNRDSKVVLWNPFIRRYKNLPRNGVAFSDSTLFGFGYDNVGDDYKVVCVSRIMGSKYDVLCIQVWVFGLRSNSWRRVQDFPDLGGDYMHLGKFANGALHWKCCVLGKILAFDLSNETFYEVPLPVCKDPLRSRLEVSDGCLGVRSFTVSRSSELYIRKSHHGGGGMTWYKLYSIQKGHICDGYLPLTYSKEEHKVLVDETYFGSHNIVWYDIQKKRGKRVQIQGMPEEFDSMVCWESLVSLG